MIHFSGINNIYDVSATFQLLRKSIFIMINEPIFNEINLFFKNDTLYLSTQS